MDLRETMNTQLLEQLQQYVDRDELVLAAFEELFTAIAMGQRSIAPADALTLALKVAATRKTLRALASRLAQGQAFVSPAPTTVM